MHSENKESQENDNDPIKGMGKIMKSFVEETKEKTGKDASFEDFLSLMNKTDAEDYQSYLNLFGMAWFNAGLGKVDIRKIYDNTVTVKREKKIQESIHLTTVKIIDTEKLKENLEVEDSHSQISEIDNTSVLNEKQQKMKKNKKLLLFGETNIQDFLLLMLLFCTIIFHIIWIVNIDHHTSIFFNVSFDTLPYLLTAAFFLVISILSMIISVFYILKSISSSNIKNEIKILNLSRIFNNILLVYKNNQIIFIIAILFFLRFGLSTNYIDKYVGLNIIANDYQFQGAKNDSEGHVLIDIEMEDNQLSSKDKLNLDSTIDRFSKYYGVTYSSRTFLFKETGAIQGFDYYGKNGILYCLFFTFIEILYRAFSYFIIASIGVQLFFIIASFFVRDAFMETDSNMSFHGKSIFLWGFMGWSLFLFIIGFYVISFITTIYHWFV